jgi:hypothetical protein
MKIDGFDSSLFFPFFPPCDSPGAFDGDGEASFKGTSPPTFLNWSRTFLLLTAMTRRNLS